MTPRAPRTLALAGGLALALVLTACGSRAPDDLRQAAADAALSRGGGAAGPVVGEDGGPVTPGAPVAGPSAGPVAGPSAGPGVAPGTPGGPVAPGQSAAPLPPGGNGGATDVGVTATSIKLGLVADISGPVPGLFKGAATGARAYAAKVNAAGGVFGRRLEVVVGDGQLDCGQNRAQHEALLDDVFAFVGSFSLYDGCAVPVLKAAPGVPDVHAALSRDAQGIPNNFSVAPLGSGWRTGPLAYYKKTFGERFSHVGSIYANAGGGEATWRGARAAIEALGGAVDYERGFTPTDTDFTADIVSMRQRGVQMIYVVASDAATFARIVAAARQQSVDWPIVAGGIAYDSSFIEKAGSNADGVYNDQQFALFFNRDEASRVPAVKEFQTWTDRVAPKEKKDLFAVFGWSSMELFVQSLTKAGPRASRATLLAELRKVRSFDAGGLLAPADPAGRKPATCWVLTRVVKGAFVRLDTPPSGYRCDGGYR